MFRKIVLPILAAVGVLFAIYTVVTGNRAIPPAQPVAQPSQAPYGRYVAGAGLVEASTENIAIGTPVGGVVTAINVKVGDTVRKGDELFRVDTRDMEADLAVRTAQVSTSQAQVQTEQATLADVSDQYNRWLGVKDTAAISKDELARKQFAVETAQARVAAAQASVVAAEAAVRADQTEIDRRIVRAPVDGQVLQCKVHLGEYAPTGVLATPLIMLGDVRQMNVRVDVDENDAWRIDTTAPAVAFVRGNPQLKTELKFVRLEPYVVPKKSLTGDSTERVDTRVLQVIYGFPGGSLPVYVGQQMDVFVEDRVSGKELPGAGRPHEGATPPATAPTMPGPAGSAAG